MLSRRSLLFGLAAAPVVAPAIISEAMKPKFYTGAVWRIPQDWHGAVSFPPCEQLALRPWAEQAQAAMDEMLGGAGGRTTVRIVSRPPEPVVVEKEGCRQFVLPGAEEPRDVVMTSRKIECERDLTSEEIQIGRKDTARASDASTG